LPLVLRIRIAQVELKQETCLTHEKLYSVIVKLGNSSTTSLPIAATEELIAVPEEYLPPVGEMKVFEEMERKLHCSEAKTKMVGKLFVSNSTLFFIRTSKI